MATTTRFLADLQEVGDHFVEQVKEQPLVQHFVTGAITRDEYVRFLQQEYHYVKATTPNLAAAARSVRLDGGSDKAVLADRLEEHAREEAGHHLWILDDLESLGEPRERINQVEICPAVEAYLAYFNHIANSRHAVGFFGQAYVLETGAVGSADLMSKALRERSNIPNIENAVKFVDLHGIVDVAHVEELMRILQYVTDPEDQRSAVLCAEVSARLVLDLIEYVGGSPCGEAT